MGIDQRFKGVFTAVITPFTEDQRVDEGAFRDYVRRVVATPGVNGILTAGYTGELMALTRPEVLRLVEITAEEAGGLPVLSGISPTSTLDTISYGRDLVASGATGLQVNSPFYYILRRGLPGNMDAVVGFYKALEDGVGAPMTVFQYPTSFGVAYPSVVLAEIAKLDQVIGIKAATPMEQYVSDHEAVAGRAYMFADNNTYTLLGMLEYGADGTMVGIGNVGTEHWVRLWELSRDGHRAEAVEHMNTHLVPLISVLSQDMGATSWVFSARVKECLRLMGILPNAIVRDPEPQVTAEDTRILTAALASAGLV